MLTGGGDAPGLNAVIRAVVKAAANCGCEVIGLEDSFDGLIEPDRWRKLTRELSEKSSGNSPTHQFTNSPTLQFT